VIERKSQRSKIFMLMVENLLLSTKLQLWKLASNFVEICFCRTSASKTEEEDCFFQEKQNFLH